MLMGRMAGNQADQLWLDAMPAIVAKLDHRVC
jgi:hypothetical protein